jgi:hypothetical protein
MQRRTSGVSDSPTSRTRAKQSAPHLITVETL